MTAPVPRSTTPTQFARIRLLLADDSIESHILVRSYLRDAPCRVEVVSDGEQAVASFKAHPFDLVLIDHQMPIMDGFTATRLIRAWESSQQRAPAPILALTAQGVDEAQEQSRSAGCTGLLTKPLTQRRLLETVQTYCAAQLGLSLATLDQSATDMTARIEEELARRRPLFLAHRRADLEEMRNAVDHGDYNRLKSMGHRIKGLAGSYGYPEIGTAGAYIELAANACHRASVEQALTEMEVILSRIDQAGQRDPLLTAPRSSAKT